MGGLGGIRTHILLGHALKACVYTVPPLAQATIVFYFNSNRASMITKKCYNISITKNLTYLIELTYDREYKGYVADVANLYGCMSQGKTKVEALKNTKKAIKAYMEAMEKSEKGKKIEKEIINIPISVASI